MDQLVSAYLKVAGTNDATKKVARTIRSHPDFLEKLRAGEKIHGVAKKTEAVVLNILNLGVEEASRRRQESDVRNFERKLNEETRGLFSRFHRLFGGRRSDVEDMD